MNSYIIQTAELQVTQAEFLIRLMVATGIGFLIGLEREHEALLKGERVFAGIRTFVLLTLLGFIGATMTFLLLPWIFGLILLAITLLTCISYWITASRGNIGSTTELTVLLTVLLGGLTLLGYVEVSLMITVIVVVLLSLKPKLQFIIGKITQEEFYDFIRFVVLVLLLFPFLPDATFGPYDVINPKEIGLVILLVSGLGFIGYVLMRVLGAGKGILLTGIIGGLVSSTVVTWVFSKRSKEQPSLSSNCATAILAASSIMVVRVFILVFIFNRALITGLYLPMGLVFLTAFCTTLYFYFLGKNQQKVEADIPPGKPLNLTGALAFGALYTVIIFIVAYANSMFGEKGIYFTSGFAGLTDVDAITISVSKLGSTAFSINTALNAILIATISNTAVKTGIALWAGSKELRKYIYLGYGLMFLAALIGFGMINF